MKIESIFQLSALKKDRRSLSLVIEVANAKMANMLIKKGLVLDHTLDEYMRYNPICRIKQYFNCYEYGHVSVHCQKSTKCGACSGPHKTSKCPQDKAPKCPLCNGAYLLWDKQYENKKKKYLRMEAAKQNTPRLYEIRSKTSPPKKKNFEDIKLPPRPQQRSQFVNVSPQA